MKIVYLRDDGGGEEDAASRGDYGGADDGFGGEKENHDHCKVSHCLHQARQSSLAEVRTRKGTEGGLHLATGLLCFSSGISIFKSFQSYPLPPLCRRLVSICHWTSRLNYE